MKTIAITACLLIPVLAVAEGSMGKIVVVPKGVFVRTDNPPCGVPNNLGGLSKNKALIGGIAKTFGPQTAAVVAGISQADEVMQNSGGDIAGLWNQGMGRKAGASCAVVCVRLPSKARPKKVVLSNRSGGDAITKPFVDGQIIDNASTGDWSGWRAVVSANDNGRWMVCGKATNWSHDQEATKRIAVKF